MVFKLVYAYRKMKPYQEQVLEENTFIREFSQDIDELDLIWHIDDEDRTIVAIEETNWLFQFDLEHDLILRYKWLFDIYNIFLRSFCVYQ